MTRIWFFVDGEGENALPDAVWPAVPRVGEQLLLGTPHRAYDVIGVVWDGTSPTDLVARVNLTVHKVDRITASSRHGGL